eukprot:ANDGO_01427.mRNA.1 Ultraviolet-B receptor UVR8
MAVLYLSFSAVSWSSDSCVCTSTGPYRIYTAARAARTMAGNSDGRAGIPTHLHRLYFLRYPSDHEFSRLPHDVHSAAATGVVDCACNSSVVVWCNTDGEAYIMPYSGPHASSERLEKLVQKVRIPFLQDEDHGRSMETESKMRGKEVGREKVVQVACGLVWILFLTNRGRVFAMGENTYGFLGTGFGGAPGTVLAAASTNPDLLLGYLQSRPSPVLIPFFVHQNADGSTSPQPLYSGKIVQIVASRRMSAAVTSTGEAYIWGTRFGGLGCSVEETDARQPVPLHIHFPSDDRKIEKIAIGRDHALAFTSSGRLFVWGSMGDGRLGTGNGLVQWTPGYLNLSYVYSSANIPLGVTGVPPVVDIACGERHSLVCMADGSVLSAGRSLFGRLGRHSLSEKEDCKFGFCPPFIPAASSSPSATSSNSAATKSPSGRPSFVVSQSNASAGGPAAHLSAVAVACGDECSYVIDSQNRLFSCGDTQCDVLPHDSLLPHSQLLERGIVLVKVSAWDKQCLLLVSEPKS